MCQPPPLRRSVGARCSGTAFAWPCLQVRALARDLGFLSLADSLKGESGKVAEAAAEVAAKLRL